MKRILIPVVFAVSVASFLSFQQVPKFDLNASVVRGKEVYNANCMSCHQEQGEGVEGVFPPLAKADYLMADKNRAILQVLKGAKGEMKVNGVVYNGAMDGYSYLTDKEVSDVLNYIRNSFGNKGAAVKPENVKALRAAKH